MDVVVSQFDGERNYVSVDSPPVVVRDKTLLIYGLLSSSGRADRSGRLVAYDKATGATLGAVPLPGAPLGTPMTYAIKGKQYVALTLLGGQMVSLALP